MTKEIEVNYDFDPFLKVNPTELLFRWSEILLDNPQAESYVKYFNYTTNMPTVLLNPSNAFNIGSHKVELIDGRIKITAAIVNKTEEFTFDVIATNGIINLKETVKVIINPNLSDVYRINFRVINDPIAGGADALKRWANCHIYLYNENKSTGEVIEFAGTFPGKAMLYEYNDGWFTVDIPKESRIQPGKTLAIFTYWDSTIKWKIQQRYPGHMEPGVPLFNFDDAEGWFVYDPSVETGKLSFYDDKPIIDKDITYTFHFKVAKYFWNERLDPNKGFPRLWLYTAYGEKADPSKKIFKPHTYSPFNNKFWWDSNSNNIYWNDDSNKLEFERWANDGDAILMKSIKLDAVFDNHIKDFHFSIQRNKDAEAGNNNKYWHRYPEYRDYFLEYSKDNWSGDKNYEADKYYIFDGRKAYEGWLNIQLYIQLGTPPSSTNIKWVTENPNW